jgi:acyl carrier protein
MDREAFVRLVQAFIVSHSVDRKDADFISAEADLFEEGHVTSLTFLSLISHLEDKLEIIISLRGLDKGTFRTINRMYEGLLHER